MRSRVVMKWIVLTWAGFAASCTGSSETPPVVFGSAGAVGRWQVEPTGTAGAGPIAGGAGASGSAFVTAGSTSEGTVASNAGSNGGAGMIASAGRGAAGTAAGSSGSGGAAAGSGASVASAATSLAFDVTTSAVGGKYQPKNIGAIWIQDKNGKLIKSLQVWAATRRRYLTRYAASLGGGSVDVTASATLSSHRAHHVTWDMKDRSGAAVTPGAYTLVMELTDADTTGRSSTVAFDTTEGALTVTPPNAPSFGSLKLELK
jgi:hypothetical protein